MIEFMNILYLLNKSKKSGRIHKAQKNNWQLVYIRLTVSEKALKPKKNYISLVLTSQKLKKILMQVLKTYKIYSNFTGVKAAGEICKNDST